MSTLDRSDVEAERLKRSVDNQGFELDDEETRWSEIFTPECGFFSAARLRGLLLTPLCGGARWGGRSSTDHERVPIGLWPPAPGA